MLKWSVEEYFLLSHAGSVVAIVQLSVVQGVNWGPSMVEASCRLPPAKTDDFECQRAFASRKNLSIEIAIKMQFCLQ